MDNGEMPAVGKSYKFPDGGIRWLTRKSRRGNFHLLLLDPRRDIWTWDGTVHKSKIPRGMEDTGDAPSNGERWRFDTGLGTITSRRGAP